MNDLNFSSGIVFDKAANYDHTLISFMAQNVGWKALIYLDQTFPLGEIK